MRALEQAAIQSGRVTGLALMERAGQGVVEAIAEHLPQARVRHDARAVVLCGPGNNGGDGFVVARLLKAQGWSVAVLSFGDAERLPPDARDNYDRWVVDATVEPLTLAAAQREVADVWVDALFGIGLTRPVIGEVGAALDWLDRNASERLVAVDVPSGLDADSGTVPEGGVCPHCALTVTFHAPKSGHLTGEGPAHCGKLIVKDIGL